MIYTHIIRQGGMAVHSPVDKMFEADILPDSENGRMNIRVHSASRPAANRVLEQLFEHLNSAHSGTDLKTAFDLGGYPAPNKVSKDS